MIYLSQRGKVKIPRFQEAVNKAVTSDNNVKNTSCHLQIIPSKEMPELSIIDYLLWAVQRKLISDERRQFNAIIDKFATITNLYE